MENKSKNILITKEEIAKKIKELGKLLNQEYKNKNLYVLSLLRGSFIFTSDLVREIDLPLKIGFMTTSSYKNSETSSGKVNILNDILDDIHGYDVLIVDDIIDTGITMDFVINYIKSRGASSIKSCVLLDKPERRKISLEPDFYCFKIPDVFVAGYGLNYGDYYRNIPYIFNWD
ncbi:hypoxanthine phosphoribosyltransferase [Clostridium sp. MT-14]|jgi:hypoxanthine phosphoribosyltransferase|uniref:Hypoxanthine phosphoribosyltransferase n=1 Tax=Clostridium aromativorans TaxID=2836848 RepID=A0ABS8N7Z4_9CLOT|nr:MULTISPECIES: hypoxanthine phosphoribosyltransferase [Clostridium]KAA8666305.1 hypoxanthine phosphoribosyltransferase [Clostridium sp. HV4-5-A1G]MCC9295917.1 hypoxanthine phosphoribosyltransferase [Clostridium aromativorans]CAB1251527.1 Hypoxanthine-guanine phosphoribosyltransferase [Clostridiaceae bacterium BL-3]